jgi:hypothetical protein
VSKETISITTYAESEPLPVPDGLSGKKGAISTVPDWKGPQHDLVETKLFVRREIPVETIERELQKLIGLMNRIFSQVEQSQNDDLTAKSSPLQMDDKSRLRLNEVTLTVEVNAEGGLSILGAGGKLGGKGGITIKFSKT